MDMDMDTHMDITGSTNVQNLVTHGISGSILSKKSLSGAFRAKGTALKRYIEGFKR